MSRIGMQPVEVPQGVEVIISDGGRFGGQTIKIIGPLGELYNDVRPDIILKLDDNKIFISRKNGTKQAKSLHGLYRTIISNMIYGVTKGYKKELEIVGIGYKAELNGSQLVLHLGATHPYVINAPQGISFEVNDKVNITVNGIDKQLV